MPAHGTASSHLLFIPIGIQAPRRELVAFHQRPCHRWVDPLQALDCPRTFG